MAVLVTGGAGYIGSHTVLALRDRGENAVVLDNLLSGSRRAVPNDVPLVVGDVGDVELVLRVIRNHNVDAILHFAAKISAPESVGDPLSYYLNNTSKTRDLLEAAVRAKVKHFVFSSSAAVYGNPIATPVSEEAAAAPLSPYGMSKLMCEQMLRDVGAAHDLKFVALRYFNVAGADPSGRLGQMAPGATHLLKQALETALGRRTYLSVYGDDYPTLDGTGVRDYVHVYDLASAHLVALDYLRRGESSRTLNCGYGRGYSVNEVITAVKLITGVDFEVRKAPRRPGDPASVVANSTELLKLGWSPKLNDLLLIVQHAFAWEKRL